MVGGADELISIAHHFGRGGAFYEGVGGAKGEGVSYKVAALAPKVVGYGYEVGGVGTPMINIGEMRF